MESFPPPTDETDLWIALYRRALPAGDLLALLPLEVGKRIWNRLLDVAVPILRACETPKWAKEQPAPLPPPPALARVPWPESLGGRSSASLHRLVSLTICSLADALEVFIRCPAQRAAALALLREEMRRLAGVYQVFAQRTWYAAAVVLFEWGLRRLRYRGSQVVCALLWGEENAGPGDAPGLAAGT